MQYTPGSPHPCPCCWMLCSCIRSSPEPREGHRPRNWDKRIAETSQKHISGLKSSTFQTANNPSPKKLSLTQSKNTDFIDAAVPPAPLTSCSFTLTNATKLHKYTHTEIEKERDKEGIVILTATELSPCLVCTAPSVESCKMSPVFPDPSLCSRRGGDRTLLCPGLVPSPQLFVRSPLSGLESSHLLSPLQRKKKTLFFLFFLVVLFQHYYSCYFSIYISMFFFLGSF